MGGDFLFLVLLISDMKTPIAPHYQGDTMRTKSTLTVEAFEMQKNGGSHAVCGAGDDSYRVSNMDPDPQPPPLGPWQAGADGRPAGSPESVLSRAGTERAPRRDVV